MRWPVCSLLSLTLLLNVGGGASAQAPAFEKGHQPSSLPAPSKAAVESYNAGVVYMQDSKPSEAAAKFRESLVASPDFVNAHCNLGTALMMQGDPQSALPELKKAVELDPHMSAAWATLGSCYQSIGQTQDAVQSFHRYLQIAPTGSMAPKVKALSQSLEVELKRTQGITKVDADDYFSETTYGGLARWRKMPIRVYIAPADAVPGYKPMYLEIFKQALTDWEQASGGKVSFEFVTDQSKGQITVAFTHSLRNAITAAEGGHTMIVPDSKGGMIGANISLLTVPLTGDELSPNYARRVDLHEIGHALGLLGHSKNPDDIMFASVLPSTKSVALTARDVKTLTMLYGEEGTNLASKGIDTSKLVSGDPTTVMNRVLTLNNEAKALMDAKKLPEALKKLEQARALDPDDPVVNTNLGSVYGNMAGLMFNMRDFTDADVYYKKAIPMLEKGSGQTNLGLILKNYSLMLHRQNRTAEAAKIDAKLANLNVQ